MSTVPGNSINPEIAIILDKAVAAIREQVIAESRAAAPSQLRNKRLLTVAEAAAYLNRSESAVRQLVFKHKLPVIRFDRVIRIDVRDLDKLIEESRA